MTSKKNKFPLKSRSWVSVRGRALTRRIADYFGLSYPHEFTSAVSLLIALMFLRVVTVMHYKFGADEPQHLHVIWGWARGFVQYRDLADNRSTFSPSGAPIGSDRCFFPGASASGQPF